LLVYLERRQTILYHGRLKIAGAKFRSRKVITEIQEEIE